MDEREKEIRKWAPTMKHFYEEVKGYRTELEKTIDQNYISNITDLLAIIDGLREEVETAWGEARDNLRNGVEIIKQRDARLAELQTDYEATVIVAGENLKRLTTLKAENSILREQNSAMSKRLAEIGKAMEPIKRHITVLDLMSAEHRNGTDTTDITIGDLRNLIAAVKGEDN